ncbi:MAG: HlyD family efflux transporter periplasmic adaptor subunit, partial [Planctomycetaceae bacterium]
VWPPPERENLTRAGELAAWNGSVLDRRNLDTSLETGTLFCEVGAEGEFEVKLLIDQSRVEFVAPGQKVDLLLDQAPGQPLAGEIVELSQAELEDLPPPLARHADLATEIDERGQPRPLESLYQARVRLLDTGGLRLLPRQTGRGRIHAGGRSLFSRATRLFAETFGLEAWRNVGR